MSVTTETYRVQVTLATAVQAIPVTFYFLEQDDLIVYQTVAGVDTLMVLNTNYTLTGEGVEAGGTLTTIGGTVGAVWTIARADALTQSEEFLYSGSLVPAAVERGYDRLAMQIQRLYGMVARSLRFPVTNAEGGELVLNSRKGSIIGFNATTGALEYTLTQDIIDDAAAAALPSEVAAQAAQAAAEIAETNAELAETNAETAEANAELAETNAETAETNATNQAGIATTQAGIATTQAGIATTQAGLATTNGAAQVTLAAAQVTLATTQAGLATTNGAAQVTLAAAQVTLATAQASAAAGSAVTALNAIAQAFKGGVAGASVPATSTATGNTYRITSAGTSQSKTWAIGDAAIYNGSSGSWTQLTGWFAYCDVQAGIASQGFKGYLQSDGATSNRGQVQGPFDATNNPRGWVAGAAVMEWCGWVDVPSTSLGATAYLFLASVGASPAHPDRPISSLAASMFSSNLTLAQRGATQDSDSRTSTFSTFRTTYSGQRVWLSVILTQGTATNPVVKVNGTDISASFSLTTGGTPPAWLDAAMVPTYHLTGYNWPAGRAPLGQWILGSLTTAESLAWMQTGQPPAWVAAGGSMQQRITDTARNSVFSAAGTDWERSANGSHVIDNANGELDVTCTGDGRTRLPELAFGGNYVTNDRWFIAIFTIANWAMTAPITPFMDVSNAPLSFGLITGNGTYTLQGYRPAQLATGGKFVIENLSSTGSYSIKNVKIMLGGALSLPVVQPIAVLDDATTIGGNQARLLGMTPVTDKKAWIICQDVYHAGADNKRILEGALIDTAKDVIDSIEQTPSTGTPTTLLGSVSAGAQYKASSALAAGINPVTLVTRKTATTEFWSQASTACLLRNTITGHRAN